MEPSFLAAIVDRLKQVAGVEAVVLGGSRARGTHTPTSDVDLGIYYTPSAPLDLAELARAAQEIDDDHRADLITPIGGWGPWINGGGWLKARSLPVDFLYRDLDKVSRIIEDCREGRIEVAYQAGHPHGFMSYIYLSEVALCQPLWDPRGTLARLKERVRPYPPKLKQVVVKTFFWEAEFSLRIGIKSASRGDVAYAAGCLFRCAACLAQTLFALNEEYWMNEKGAVRMVSGFRIAPPEFQGRVEQAFDTLSRSAEEIEAAVGILQGVVSDCEKFVSAAEGLQER